MTDDLSWISDALNNIESENELEKSDIPDQASIERQVSKRQMVRIAKMKMAGEAIAGGLPKPGASIHVISGGVHDYWSIVPVAIEMLGGVDEFYGSTWTMNRENVLELLELIDKGLIKKASMLTGLYFKRRESSVFAQLLTGMLARGQRFVAFNNHAKVILMHKGDDYMVFEGSANFTSNPRMENYCIINDQALYEFHQAWMEEMLKAHG